MEALILLLFSIVPAELTAEDRVDVAELNHFYDENGRLVFEQVIFYRWCWDYERYQVYDWRLVKNPTFLPQRDWELGGYVCRWDDGEFRRTVRADSFRETWTQYDPELAEREFLPKEQRMGLSKPDSFLHLVLRSMK
jgi:hypothetical protein